MASASSDANNLDNQPLVASIVPEFYINAHRLQRTFSVKALDLLELSFASANDASQQFLDVGCGTGDFTRQELLPRCEPCRRIVATDASPAMVKYAKENFSHQKIAYELHDIESDASRLVEKYGKFERVYSFFALNWVEDLAAAVRNVADLMTEDGECLLVVPARICLYRIWRRIVEMDRWKEYKNVVERFIPQSQDIRDGPGLTSYMLDILQKANLKPRTCKVLTQDARSMDRDEFIQIQLSLNPIMPLLSEESKTILKRDVAEVALKFLSEKPAGDPQYLSDVFVVHANKISNQA
ncbi:juvenile hormone acid O-methyltransferase-like [Ixodes scapularis]|uniref:juvenile hormone acid O-methyltransferase-like n=1 Tax=Ixodes scapularis TaxID=6945 RepID=UPI001A9E19DC|nr:juvenile hormone acid O-methyltransferase-like [Ixodes scapularis]